VCDPCFVLPAAHGRSPVPIHLLLLDPTDGVILWDGHYSLAPGDAALAPLAHYDVVQRQTRPLASGRVVLFFAGDRQTGSCCSFVSSRWPCTRSGHARAGTWSKSSVSSGGSAAARRGQRRTSSFLAQVAEVVPGVRDRGQGSSISSSTLNQNEENSTRWLCKSRTGAYVLDNTVILTLYGSSYGSDRVCNV
jgi:hypothetical protein